MLPWQQIIGGGRSFAWMRSFSHHPLSAGGGRLAVYGG